MSSSEPRDSTLAARADVSVLPSSETPTSIRAGRGALVCYGLATFFSFPHEMPGSGQGSLDLGLFFGWLGPAALLIGLEGLAPRRAAWAAFWASLVCHSVFFHWFMVVTIEYGGMPLLLGALAPLVPALYVSIFTALFVWGFALWRSTRAEPHGLSSILMGAAWWVAVDWARGHFLGGFPWATLGYALYLDAPLMALVRWFGVYGLSFVLVAVGIALANAWVTREQAAYRSLLLTLVLVAALHGLGAGMNGSFAPGSGAPLESVRAAAIQGNIDQGEKWDADRRTRIQDTYLRLSEQAASEGVDWIVWPETAVPGLIENDPVLRAQLGDLARRHGVFLVVGGMGVEIDRAARRFSAFFDSAFQFDPQGQVQDRYDKTHLVPFGEFVPLRGLLGHFFQSLATGLSSNDVTPGPRVRNMILAQPGDPGPGRVVGVPICYELLFPHLVRGFGAQGAGALLAITNDAWYGRTGAPHQFLAMTAMRSAENGRPTVRAANTGISAIIDARGRIEKRSPLFEEAIVVGEIQFVRDGPPTFYARFGDVFALICCVLSLPVIFRAAWRVRRDALSESSPHEIPEMPAA